MNDDQLRTQLREQTEILECDRAPSFDDVLAAAEKQVGRARQRRRYAGGLVAAAVVVGIIATLVSSPQPEWQYVDPAMLADSTSWEAPSDVLLPEHSFDIYEDIPVFIEGTEVDEGALL